MTSTINNEAFCILRAPVLLYRYYIISLETGNDRHSMAKRSCVICICLVVCGHRARLSVRCAARRLVVLDVKIGGKMIGLMRRAHILESGAMFKHIFLK